MFKKVASGNQATTYLAAYAYSPTPCTSVLVETLYKRGRVVRAQLWTEEVIRTAERQRRFLCEVGRILEDLSERVEELERNTDSPYTLFPSNCDGCGFYGCQHPELCNNLPDPGTVPAGYRTTTHEETPNE